MNKNLLTVLAVSFLGMTLMGCSFKGKDRVPQLAENQIMEGMNKGNDIVVSEIKGKYQSYSVDKFKQIRGTQKFVLFFYANWCSTCRKWEKNIQENLENLPEGTLILKADYDSETSLVKEFGVTSQSTAVFFNMDGSIAEIKVDPSLDEINNFFAE